MRLVIIFANGFIKSNDSFINQTCVKAKAVESVAITRPEVDREEIWASCDRVFDRCYADLEPIGRRPRAGSDDYKKAYRERFYYGYY